MPRCFDDDRASMRDFARSRRALAQVQARTIQAGSPEVRQIKPIESLADAGHRARRGDSEQAEHGVNSPGL